MNVILNKGLEHEYVHLDSTVPEHKKRMLELSPAGTVPVVFIGDEKFTESLDASIALSKLPEGKSLYPSEDTVKWQEFVLAELWSLNTLFYKHYPHQQAELKPKLLNSFRVFEKQLASSYGEGPFFFGDKVSMVDCMSAPLAFRLLASKELRGFVLPAELPYVARYYEGLVKLRDTNFYSATPEAIIERTRARLSEPPLGTVVALASESLLKHIDALKADAGNAARLDGFKAFAAAHWAAIRDIIAPALSGVALPAGEPTATDSLDAWAARINAINGPYADAFGTLAAADQVAIVRKFLAASDPLRDGFVTDSLEDFQVEDYVKAILLAYRKDPVEAPAVTAFLEKAKHLPVWDIIASRVRNL